MFASWKLIHPEVVQTDDSLTLIPVRTSVGDFFMMFIIVAFGGFLTMTTTNEWMYRIAGMVIYSYLAWTLVVDTFVTVFDKKKQEVSITKYTMGYRRYVRVAPLDEIGAIQTSLLPTPAGKKKGTPLYRLELEFTSDHGFYRMPLTEGYINGEKNIQILKDLEERVRKFLGLKKMPDWMQEEELEKRFGGPNGKPERRKASGKEKSK
ncbi:hypothetical protein DFS34DRAFT_590761 [Phlyctochytrium arcticum]|nr:hypothetical protein DFS34DRAFT_590761 [Phlyctochytrium arcticum]